MNVRNSKEERRRKKMKHLGGDKTLSRQRRYQLRKREKGLCVICGKNPLLAGERCRECNERFKVNARKRGGFKAWRVDGPGRPPIDFKHLY
jgi:hypothetical protein